MRCALRALSRVADWLAISGESARREALRFDQSINRLGDIS
jgi:hypothetical protein